MAAVTGVSRNINRVYCIHWVFVVWSTMVALYLIRGTQELPMVWTLLLGAGISTVSIIIAHFWSDRTKKDRQGEKK